MFEDAQPRPQRGAALSELGREDLEQYSAEELSERIGALENEIARTRAAIEARHAKTTAAHALFNFDH